MGERVGIEVSTAIAEAAMLADIDVVAAYPITPQTHIVEHLAELVASGELDAEYIPVESEHSAMSACLGSSAASARTERWNARRLGSSVRGSVSDFRASNRRKWISTWTQNGTARMLTVSTSSLLIASAASPAAAICPAQTSVVTIAIANVNARHRPVWKRAT